MVEEVDVVVLEVVEVVVGPPKVTFHKSVFNVPVVG